MTTAASLGLVPYIRQSRRRERSISVDEQRRAITAWASAEGVDLAPEVSELGVSGSKPWRRRELGRAIEACERGKAGGLIVSYQDRLSRESGLATAEVWEALEKCGARLVCASEGLDTANGDGEMLFTIKSAIAREQWKRVKRNWADARRSAVERGIHPCANVPLGYARGPDRRLVPDPAAVDVVRGIFRLRSRGASWNEICDHLDSNGVAPAKGSHWVAASVAKIVRNRVYLGEAFHGEYRNPSAHAPLVTRASWQAAQRRFPGRIVRGTQGTRLSGLVFCSACGGRLSPGGDHYRCLPRRSVHRDACTAPAYARIDRLDALVVDGFLKRYDDAIGQFDDEPESPDATPLARKLAQAEDALRTLIDDPLSLAALPPDARTTLLVNAQAEVDAAQAAVDAVTVAHETSVLNVWRAHDLFELDGFKELSIPEQRRLLGAGIERVVIGRGKRGEAVDGRVSIEWREEN